MLYYNPVNIIMNNKKYDNKIKIEFYEVIF